MVWTDAIQMLLYVGGAILSMILLLGRTAPAEQERAWQAGKFQVFDLHAPILTSPYALVTAVLGGAVFTMASHGSDQLMVQRILGCRSLADGRKAMIGSAVLVMLQFALFSLVGTLLWIHSGGSTLQQLGLASADRLFPRFIVQDLPPGLAGLLIAGILGATMGSLSSAMNSMSNSTVTDLIHLFSRRACSDAAMLRLSRVTTLLWAGALVGFASMFTDTRSPVIVLGLSITGYTYGALLGAFLLGALVRRADQRHGTIAFVATLLVMAVVVLAVRFHGQPLAFPWYVPLGAALTLVVGALCSRLHTPDRVQAGTGPAVHSRGPGGRGG